jgi:hypothetical protein
MESGMTGFKGQGLSAFDKKPLAERFGNKQVTSNYFSLYFVCVAYQQKGAFESQICRRQECRRSWEEH